VIASRMFTPVSSMTSRGRPLRPIAHRRGAVLERAEEVLSSCIASWSPPAARADCSVRRRRCSTGSTRLGVGGGQLDAADDQVPGLGESWVVAVLAGQGRNVGRVVTARTSLRAFS